jgi:hypothetical protein
MTAGTLLHQPMSDRRFAYSTRVDPSVPEAFRNDLSPLAGGLTVTAALVVLLVTGSVLFRRSDA